VNFGQRSLLRDAMTVTRLAVAARHERILPVGFSVRLLIKVLLLCVFALLASGDGVAAEGGDPLWQRAVATAAANRQMMPGSAVIRTTVLDGKGERRQQIETWVEFAEGDGGRVVSTMVRRVEDGRELTSSEREARNLRDSRRGRHGSFTLGDTPFNPEYQQVVTHRRTGRTRSIGGRPSVGFEFRFPKDEIVVEGLAWLDAATGTPHLMEFAPSPLPRFVRQFEGSVRFRVDAQGRWVPSQMSMRGSGGALWIHRQFASVVEFSDHRQRRG
jgi:hypothetical protein